MALFNDQEAQSALRDAVVTVHIAQSAVIDSDYGSEVRSAIAEALRAVTYELVLVEGRI
jgi:hypothetical protein